MALAANRSLLKPSSTQSSCVGIILNFNAAVGQAEQGIKNQTLANLLIFMGLGAEIVMSLGIFTGIADRLAAFILAGYCGVTALLWKQFWTEPHFRLKGKSAGREIFWDFLKNFALAGGFLIFAFGSNATGVQQFIADPFASSHPYAIRQTGP